MYPGAGSSNTINVSNFNSMEVCCDIPYSGSGMYAKVYNQTTNENLVMLTTTVSEKIDVSIVDSVVIQLGSTITEHTFPANITVTVTLK